MKIFVLFLKGMCMGATDIVPGVSGGTMALMLGLYRQFIDSLHKLGKLHFTFFIKLFRKDSETYSLAGFLLPLGLGILVGIWLMAQILTYWLNHYPNLVYAFFCGLILSAVVRMFKTAGVQQLPYWALGFLLGFAATWLTNLPIPDGWLFIAGFLAIGAMLLPGISGAFILLILGQYERVLAAVHVFPQPESFWVLLQLLSGVVVGLLVFPKILIQLLHRFPKPTFAVLGGLMLGSINKIWPFVGFSWADNAGALGLLLLGLVVGWVLQLAA